MDELLVSISRQLGSSSRIIAICLATTGGYMNLGSVDTSLHTQPGISVAYDGANSDSISNHVGAISMGGKVISENGGA